ncbi:hypothetical protein GFL88_19340 [Rhizobium leguminosarum bv. viciae]|uniref:hypothetical protein n=1 Tax=Rhizobium leguminosarum TaxID=384 RepID=UPI00144103D0|nr:hypothetical protein [Rhizobium leguminosarum]NKK65645.1 hypothetical protein [Rhizobium leguminosarum bv. viciae]
MHPNTVLISRDIPYLFDFWYSSNGVNGSARPGHFIDAMLIDGGIMLWCGQRQLTVELHFLRALTSMFRGLRHDNG